MAGWWLWWLWWLLAFVWVLALAFFVCLSLSLFFLSCRTDSFLSSLMRSRSHPLTHLTTHFPDSSPLSQSLIHLNTHPALPRAPHNSRSFGFSDVFIAGEVLRYTLCSLRGRRCALPRTPSRSFNFSAPSRSLSALTFFVCLSLSLFFLERGPHFENGAQLCLRHTGPYQNNT